MKLPLVNIIFEEGFPIYLDCEQNEVLSDAPTFWIQKITHYISVYLKEILQNPRKGNWIRPPLIF